MYLIVVTMEYHNSGCNKFSITIQFILWVYIMIKCIFIGYNMRILTLYLLFGDVLNYPLITAVLEAKIVLGYINLPKEFNLKLESFWISTGD